MKIRVTNDELAFSSILHKLLLKEITHYQRTYAMYYLCLMVISRMESSWKLSTPVGTDILRVICDRTSVSDLTITPITDHKNITSYLISDNNHIKIIIKYLDIRY